MALNFFTRSQLTSQNVSNGSTKSIQHCFLTFLEVRKQVVAKLPKATSGDKEQRRYPRLSLYVNQYHQLNNLCSGTFSMVMPDKRNSKQNGHSSFFLQPFFFFLTINPVPYLMLLEFVQQILPHQLKAIGSLEDCHGLTDH